MLLPLAPVSTIIPGNFWPSHWPLLLGSLRLFPQALAKGDPTYRFSSRSSNGETPCSPLDLFLGQPSTNSPNQSNRPTQILHIPPLLPSYCWAFLTFKSSNLPRGGKGELIKRARWSQALKGQATLSHPWSSWPLLLNLPLSEKCGDEFVWWVLELRPIKFSAYKGYQTSIIWEQLLMLTVLGWIHTADLQTKGCEWH